MRTRRTLASALLLALAVSGAACSGDDDAGSGATTSTGSRATSTDAPTTTAPRGTTTAPADRVTTTTVACPGLQGASTADRRGSPAGSTGALLTAVAWAGGCTDTVTFGFRAADRQPPGYETGYRAGPIRADASGEVVAVDGRAFLVVRMEPAYGFDFESGAPTYTGPRRIAPAGGVHVREIVETGDFEAVLTWVIGLDSARPYQVVTTGDIAAPTLRIVIG
jgi:hypothetical protein